jgi:hypothetical protein
VVECSGLLNRRGESYRGFESLSLRHMDKSEFAQLITQACHRETSADPKGWNEDNATWGHCAVVALLAQDYYGGQILRASLAGTPFESSGSHYRNEDDDFTENQFGDAQLDLMFEPRSREYLLSNLNTATRYQLLKTAFNELLQ